MSIIPASSIVCARQFGPGCTLGACAPLAGDPCRSSAETNALQPRTAPHDLCTCLHMSCACSSALLHTRPSPRAHCTPAHRRTSGRRAALAAASAHRTSPNPDNPTGGLRVQRWSFCTRPRPKQAPVAAEWPAPASSPPRSSAPAVCAAARAPNDPDPLDLKPTAWIRTLFS